MAGSCGCAGSWPGSGCTLRAGLSSAGPIPLSSVLEVTAREEAGCRFLVANLEPFCGFSGSEASRLSLATG